MAVWFSGKIMDVNYPGLLLVLLFLIFSVFGLLLGIVIQKSRTNKELTTIQARFLESERSMGELRLHLKVLFRISQGFVEAVEEGKIIDLVLQSSIDVSGAMGASFVPIDERGQAKGSFQQGDFPFPAPDAWLEYLASPLVRQQCQECRNYGTIINTCPLMRAPLTEINGLYCIPLRRKGFEFGILNLYLPDGVSMVSDKKVFLQSLVDSTVIALENIRLRKHAVEIFEDLHSVRQKIDLKVSFSDLLGQILHSLDADYALLAVEDFGFTPESTSL